MKKTICAIHIISEIAGILFFVALAIKTVNGHVPTSEMTPFIIGFIICSAVSSITKSSVNHAAEENYYRMQADYMEIRNRQAQNDVEAQTQHMINLQNQQMIDLQNQQMIDLQNQQAMNSAMRAAEDARLAATGIEFGGYNPDPNLNPGMHSTMQDFECNNTFGMF